MRKHLILTIGLVLLSVVSAYSADWEKTTIADDSYGRGTASLDWGKNVAIDNNSRPRIAYVAGDKITLKYAHYTGSEWIMRKTYR